MRAASQDGVRAGAKEATAELISALLARHLQLSEYNISNEMSHCMAPGTIYPQQQDAQPLYNS